MFYNVFYFLCSLYFFYTVLFYNMFYFLCFLYLVLQCVLYSLFPVLFLHCVLYFMFSVPCSTLCFCSLYLVLHCVLILCLLYLGLHFVLYSMFSVTCSTLWPIIKCFLYLVLYSESDLYLMFSVLCSLFLFLFSVLQCVLFFKFSSVCSFPCSIFYVLSAMFYVLYSCKNICIWAGLQGRDSQLFFLSYVLVLCSLFSVLFTMLCIHVAISVYEQDCRERILSFCSCPRIILKRILRDN